MTTHSKNFRTLNLAKDFYRDCEKLAAKAHIQDQLSRASLSVVNNLAEGSAKATPKDRANFYSIALGSFRECQAMLDLLNQETLLKKYDYLGICIFNLRKFTLNPRPGP
jgi:four helix bundle protein